MGGMNGLKELTANLQRIAAGASLVAGDAISAGLGVMKANAKAACPGSTANEVGARRNKSNGGPVVSGKVGLGVGGARVIRPHARFLTAGTKYIQARHFVRAAFERSIEPAMAAMQRAAKRRLAKLAKGK